MIKAPIFNYTVSTDKGKKKCTVNIDGQIVDAETKQLYDLYFGETPLVSFKSIRDQVNQAIAEGCTHVDVWTNCQGGNVFEANAIDGYFTSLSDSGITVLKITNGLSASAATIFNGGKGSRIVKGSWYMIHNASGAIWGNVNDIENYAASIRAVNDSLTKRYCDRTGLSKTVIGNMMDKETFITAEDAVAMGFVEDFYTPDQATNITNSLKTIKPENWLFQNSQVLAAYNSAIQNPINMDFKNLIPSIKDAFTNSLKEAGILKDENQKLQESITNALDAALTPMNQGINDAIDQEITARLADLDTTITNKVKEAIEAANKEAITMQAVEDKLKPLQDSIQAVEAKLVDGAGSAGGGTTQEENEPITARNHKGIRFE